jgi:hypothetical protein
MQINHGEEGTKFSWLNTSPPYGGYLRWLGKPHAHMCSIRPRPWPCETLLLSSFQSRVYLGAPFS